MANIRKLRNCIFSLFVGIITRIRSLLNFLAKINPNFIYFLKFIFPYQHKAILLNLSKYYFIKYYHIIFNIISYIYNYILLHHCFYLFYLILNIYKIFL